MKNKDKAMYESPQSEIIELKLRGGIAQPQLVVTSDPQFTGLGDEEEI